MPSTPWGSGSHYRVLRKIGGVGMGEVYEGGQDLNVGVVSRVKFLSENLANDSGKPSSRFSGSHAASSGTTEHLHRSTE